MSLHNWLLTPERVKRYPFLSLVAPGGGVVRSLAPLASSELHVPSFRAVISSAGHLSMAYPYIAEPSGNAGQRLELGGCGADETQELAAIRAVAEAAERYATCVYAKQDVRIATFNEMQKEGITADSIPACSPEEYADPRCPLRPIDSDQPLRWVAGYSITERRTRWVPLIMTHLYVRPWASELFWLPISTGVAAHVDIAQAAVSAICEVIERDAIALTWLLQLSLPRVNPDRAEPVAQREKLRRLRESRLEHHVFDATLDCGVPTLYSVQLREGTRHAAQFVNCSTNFDAWEAYGKLIRESAVGRTILEHQLPVPESIHDFIELEHGAIYMGRKEHRSAFDFLLAPASPLPAVSLSGLSAGRPGDPVAQLNYLTEHFRRTGREIVLVDQTTDDLREAGLHVIRAVIPDLMPMSPCYSARYLGHPRLLAMKRKLEQQSGQPRLFNPYPQPFA